MKELLISQPNLKQEQFFKCHQRFIGYGGAGLLSTADGHGFCA